MIHQHQTAMKTSNIGISINPHINDKWYLMEFSYYLLILVRLINGIYGYDQWYIGYFSQIIYKCEEIMHQKFNHLTKILLITDVLRIKHNINNGRERNKKIVHYWKNQTSYSCLFLQTQHCGKYTLSQILLGLAH
eukprot:272446_1